MAAARNSELNRFTFRFNRSSALEFFMVSVDRLCEKRPEPSNNIEFFPDLLVHAEECHPIPSL